MIAEKSAMGSQFSLEKPQAAIMAASTLYQGFSNPGAFSFGQHPKLLREKSP